MRSRSLLVLSAVCLLGVIVVAFGVASVLSGSVAALPWSVFGSSGNSSSSPNFNVASTSGQGAPIGESSSTNFGVGWGFWYGLIDSDGDGASAFSDPCPGDPDCDDDLVSDGPADPDGGGPLVGGPDNCAAAPNPSQTNTDADNEAAGFRLGFGGTPPILLGDGAGDACDTDDDNDGFSDADERAIYGVGIGSDEELTPCRTATVADPWPPNTFSADNVIDISDLGAMVNAGLFSSSAGKERYNLFVDGVIDISDLGRLVNAGLFSSCESPP